MKRAWYLTVAIYFILIGTSLVIVYPLLFMVLATFTTPEQYYRTSFLPIPNLLNFSNYSSLIFGCVKGCIGLSMEITFLRVTWYIVMTLLVSIFAGYVFGRLRFPGRQAIFLFFLSGLMVPNILTVLPLYVMLARWPLAGGNNILGQGGHGFVNSWQALFILGLVDSLAIFLLKQNYEMFPSDYEEAALVDGAGFLRIIFQVYLPMLRPALTAVAVITFVGIWNDYFGPLVFVGGNDAITPVALEIQRTVYYYTQWSQNTLAPFPLIFAGAAMMSVPPIVVYLLLQQYFVQGLVGVGIKG